MATSGWEDAVFPVSGLDTRGWQTNSGPPVGRKELWQGPVAPGAGAVEAALGGARLSAGNWLSNPAGSCTHPALPELRTAATWRACGRGGTTGCLPDTLGRACTMFLKLSCREGSGEARGTGAPRLSSRQHQKTLVPLQLMGLGRSQGPGVLGGLCPGLGHSKHQS